jgi:hypothetical protein
LQQIKNRGDGFEWEPEITAKLLRAGHRIVEVPITYSPRSFRERKKLSWRDGVKAILTLIKCRFTEGREPPVADKR